MAFSPPPPWPLRWPCPPRDDSREALALIGDVIAARFRRRARRRFAPSSERPASRRGRRTKANSGPCFAHWPI